MGKMVKWLYVREDQEFRGDRVNEREKAGRGDEKGLHSLWESTTLEMAGTAIKEKYEGSPTASFENQ